jgi:hypothetical protein
MFFFGTQDSNLEDRFEYLTRLRILSFFSEDHFLKKGHQKEYRNFWESTDMEGAVK